MMASKENDLSLANKQPPPTTPHVSNKLPEPTPTVTPGLARFSSSIAVLTSASANAESHLTDSQESSTTLQSFVAPKPKCRGSTGMHGACTTTQRRTGHADCSDGSVPDIDLRS